MRRLARHRRSSLAARPSSRCSARARRRRRRRRLPGARDLRQRASRSSRARTSASPASTSARSTKLEVTPDNKAAVVLDIDERGLRRLPRGREVHDPPAVAHRREVRRVHADPAARRRASRRRRRCARSPTASAGAGQHLLPVEQHVASRSTSTSSTTSLRLPQRQRLAIILNELGAGLAGRGERPQRDDPPREPGARRDERGPQDPRPSRTRSCADLARDSDTVLAPLARDRAQRRRASSRTRTRVSQATAERRADLERNFERLPRFLEELRPTMARLGALRRRVRRRCSSDLGARRRHQPPRPRARPVQPGGHPGVRVARRGRRGRPARRSCARKPIIDDLRA